MQFDDPEGEGLEHGEVTYFTRLGRLRRGKTTTCARWPLYLGKLLMSLCPAWRRLRPQASHHTKLIT